MITRFFSRLNKQLIRPRSKNPDDQRREYIFNVLIGFITVAALATTISSGVTHLLGANVHNTNSVPGTVVFLVITAGLWWLSRKGHYKIGAYTLVILLWLASLQLALAWSIELPMAQILTILVIIIAGIMISSRAALAIAVLTSASTLLLGYIQSTGGIPVDTSWLTKPLEFSDAIGLVVIYGIVGAVSWLANNEIDSLLRRAWRSEKALAKERDQLEVTVAQRTKDLERTQLERVLELQQFAEFGRVSASLLHDLANPLTAAALNLEQAGSKRGSKLVAQAMVSLSHIESYIKTARKQLQGTGQRQRFSVNNEITEVVELLRNQASSARVRVLFTGSSTSQLHGDVVAFHRVIANILVNAIQAYDTKPGSKQPITILTVDQDSRVHIIVQDHGTGIKPVDLPHIFEDFYSTKKQIGRGLGLGLASAKQVIEHDFGGVIGVTSTPKSGTTFTIEIPIHETSDRGQHTDRKRVSGQKTNRNRRL